MAKITSGVLFDISWGKYLTILFLLLGIGFFSSGSVTWIAANWDYLSKFQKLYTTQGLLGLTTIFAIWFYIKETKRLSKERLKFISASFFFVSAILIGVLFALIGQIYQTGADPWQLFALWSILQIPLLLILPNIASALLLMLTLNVTAILYSQYSYNNFIPEFLVGLNFLLVIISETTSDFFYDKHWRVLSKCANLALASSLIIWVLNDVLISGITSFIWLIFGGLIWAYKKYRYDLFPLIVHSIGLLVSLNISILTHFGASSIFFAILLTLGATILGGVQLKKQFFAHNLTLEHNWAVQLMFTFLAILTTCLFALFLMLDNDGNSQSFLIVSVLLFVTAIYFHYRKSNSYMVDMLLAIASCLLYIYFEVETGGYLVLASITIYALIIFYLKQTLWLKSLLILLCLIIFLSKFGKLDYAFELDLEHIYINEGITSVSLLTQFIDSTISWLMLGGLICFYFTGKKKESQLRLNIIPVGWAFVLLALVLFIKKNSQFFISNNIADQLPQVTTISEFFNVITANILVSFNTSFWLSKLFYFSVVVSPLILYFVLRDRIKLSKPSLWVSAIVIMLFCIGFIASESILFCFALLLLAYTNSSKTLFGLAIFALISSLALYYYMMLVPLLYKSFLLLAFGLLFLATALFLHKQQLISVKNVDEQNKTKGTTQLTRISIITPIFTLLFVATVLGGAHYTTFKYEDLLENGESIILKIAPVDPRSLMQGDYMVLTYSILDDINQNQHNLEMNNGKNISQIYALIQNDNLGVAKLCRIELNKPIHFDGCRKDVYLPIIGVSQFRLPSQSYFFPEGKGEYYAQAEYGEYRFKGGKVLLLRLLDKDLKPL